MNTSSSPQTLERAVIIGGGLAGMVAANELRKQGVKVLIFEKGKRTGGKAGADKINGAYEEHGYHVFPAWYKNTLNLIQEIDAAGNLVPITQFHYLRESKTECKKPPSGVFPNTKVFLQLDSLRSIFHNIRNSFIPWYKAVLAFYAAIDLCSQSLKERCFLDRVSVNGFLRSRFYTSDVIAEYHHQTVIQASAIPTYELSAMTLKNLVLNWAPRPEPIFRIMNGNLQEKFIAPLEKHIRNIGVDIQQEAEVTRLETDDRRISKLHLKTSNGKSCQPLGPADVCIVATPPKNTVKLIDESLFKLEERNLSNRARDEVHSLACVEHLESAPMAAFHFYLNRKIKDLPSEHVNLFKSRFVLSFIDVSQTWEELKDTTLSVIASDSKWFRGLSEEAAAKAVYEELRRFIPTLGHWKDDIDRFYSQLNMGEETQLFLNTVGAWHFRPGTQTLISNLYIAGDYCRTEADLTTMESAVMSGRQTAATVLREAGMEATSAEPQPLRPERSLRAFLKVFLKGSLKHSIEHIPYPLAFKLAKWLFLPFVICLWFFAGKKCE